MNNPVAISNPAARRAQDALDGAAPAAGEERPALRAGISVKELVAAQGGWLRVKEARPRRLLWLRYYLALMVLSGVTLAGALIAGARGSLVDYVCGALVGGWIAFALAVLHGGRGARSEES